MQLKQQQEAMARRYQQLNNKEITVIYKLIKQELKDPELAMRVTLQLRNTEEYNQLKTQQLKDNNKSLAQRLRDIADTVSDLEYYSEYN